MAATLPLELLIQIGTSLESTGAPVTPCVTVSRRWQAAFEPLLYRKVHLYTSDNLEDFSPGRALSLANFGRITFGLGVFRRAWIRHIECCLVVPHALYDWQTIQLEDYTTDNEVRRDNDRAFQSGIIALFRTLSDWDPGLRLTLQLLISGREETLEPNTYDCTFTGPVPWSFPDGWILAVPLYRASFGDIDPPTLPVVPCIDRLWFSDDPEFDFPSDIWVGAAMQIARNCSTMSGLRLNMQEHVKPDHLDYMQARRRALAEGIKSLPPTLRDLELLSSFEYPWKWSMPGLNLLGSDHDMLSLNRRNLSINLRRLDLDEVSLAADVLFPLDEQENPLPESLSLHWPQLEVINLRVPPVLPTGRWVTLHLPERQKELDAIEDWSDIIRDVERGCGDRKLLDTDHFQRVLISLGHAARRMPNLTSLSYVIDAYPEFELLVGFTPYEHAELSLYSEHRPDKH
ncbi:uncharacterized protein BO66DRAFT_456191 [Aspergillus aculeatinus CBS 121060]|uniref:Uncharacterized protein n=1 Tax=Aspergillus aculeatinus CBS 121060 TaxID=1448322 RepID=A0ACD1H327_9EURO|nr:hypothetical protein BO66DRAFT_456191 [Aspergillus aculeatinus CBS 121060]RAH67930.1 hypothetical protein BO66DRAFT_456191 [Aspergillus aculeatinus CBS 121060]